MFRSYPINFRLYVLTVLDCVGFAGQEKFRAGALSWAQRLMSSVYRGYEAEGVVYDRYDVNQVGQKGSGGAYEAQEGFGWTNGVALRLMEMFPQELNGAAVCPLYHTRHSLYVLVFVLYLIL